MSKRVYYMMSTVLIIAAGFNIGWVIANLLRHNWYPALIGNIIAAGFVLWVFYFQYHKKKDILIKD